jgi:hypothetical protein
MRAVDDYEVLVSLEHDDGTAGVARGGDGSLSLSGYLGRGGTGLSDYRPVTVGLSGDRVVQGGPLPDGAVAVEIIDDPAKRQRAAYRAPLPCSGRWADGALSASMRWRLAQ